eukprot:CAMPEP_0196796610 /NCGR_PEP_ID=MMETSP1104-20130614/37756_1 /TAXON_ID=33652 /ORGANISM="Cafeteria sp., Strain Caron Lab Isolate" /LENGTH=331 /DNA_ID=CAMNT_0042167003 /DNA_START=78 /DNA_END=1070 /DNA_ORIENTATION=+
MTTHESVDCLFAMRCGLDVVKLAGKRASEQDPEIEEESRLAGLVDLSEAERVRVRGLLVEQLAGIASAPSAFSTLQDMRMKLVDSVFGASTRATQRGVAGDVDAARGPALASLGPKSGLLLGSGSGGASKLSSSEAAALQLNLNVFRALVTSAPDVSAPGAAQLYAGVLRGVEALVRGLQPGALFAQGGMDEWVTAVEDWLRSLVSSTSGSSDAAVQELRQLAASTLLHLTLARASLQTVLQSAVMLAGSGESGAAGAAGAVRSGDAAAILRMVEGGAALPLTACLDSEDCKDNTLFMGELELDDSEVEREVGAAEEAAGAGSGPAAAAAA